MVFVAGILITRKIHTNRVPNNIILKPAFEHEYNLSLTVILYITNWSFEPELSVVIRGF